jgi:hypothetical protein
MRPDYWEDCTIECEKRVTCTVCGNDKKPSGRSSPPEMYGCDSDCPGYWLLPKAPHLWPGELAGYDAEPEADAPEGETKCVSGK